MIGIGLEQNPYFQEVMKNLISDWEVSVNILLHLLTILLLRDRQFDATQVFFKIIHIK